MHTAIHIIDYNQNKKLFLILLDEDADRLDEVWAKRSGFTRELRNKSGIDKTKFSDLSFKEWKRLIFSLIMDFLNLSNSEQTDEENDIVKLIQLSLTGLVKRYNIDFDGNLDYIVIRRIGEFDFSLSITSCDTIEYNGNTNAS